MYARGSGRGKLPDDDDQSGKKYAASIAGQPACTEHNNVDAQVVFDRAQPQTLGIVPPLAVEEGR